MQLSIVGNKMAKITKDELLDKLSLEYDTSCEGAETYKHFKKLDYWTLDEGLKLLIAPIEIGSKSKSEYPSLFDIEFLQNSKKYDTVIRSIGKSLTIEGNYEEKKLEYKNNDAEKTVSNFWYYCCSHIRVNPFQFLCFIKDKELFDIPEQLSFSKVRLDSGAYSYYWQDEVIEKYDSSNQHDLDNDTMLSGKERQELGRLKTEKITMDATVKAAIEVGKFAQTKIDKNEKILKRDIQDLVNKIDKSIPNTRIDLIWKSIDLESKKGNGRPPKTKS